MYNPYPSGTYHKLVWPLSWVITSPKVSVVNTNTVRTSQQSPHPRMGKTCQPLMPISPSPDPSCHSSNTSHMNNSQSFSLLNLGIRSPMQCCWTSSTMLSLANQKQKMSFSVIFQFESTTGQMNSAVCQAPTFRVKMLGVNTHGLFWNNFYLCTYNEILTEQEGKFRFGLCAIHS